MQMMIRGLLGLVLGVLPGTACLQAQPDTASTGDDLMGQLDAMEPARANYTLATFKATRVMNGPSVETTRPGDLIFVVQHRFGPIDDGIDELFGLDQANTRLGFQYGVAEGVGIGIGRSSFRDYVDGYAKAKLLRQQTGKRQIPVTVTGQALVGLSTLDDPPEIDRGFADRLEFAYSLMIARKFHQGFSFQVAGHFLHRNVVETAEMPNDFWAVAPGLRVKLTDKITMNVDYHLVLDDVLRDRVEDALGVGFDIQTGGHVFQLVFTNSLGMSPAQVINRTNNEFFDGEIRFGFNLVRTFGVGRPRIGQWLGGKSAPDPEE